MSQMLQGRDLETSVSNGQGWSRMSKYTYSFIITTNEVLYNEEGIQRDIKGWNKVIYTKCN